MLPPDTRRAARLLGLSWAVSWAGVPISGAFGSVIVLEMTDDLLLSGVPFFLLYVGSLIAAYPSGHLMDRLGRKPVLIGGHLLAAFGFAVGTLAIILQNLWLFFAAQLVASMGASATYLTRLAAADLFPTSQRARGLGRLVFYLVFGAIAGVPLVRLAQALQQRVGESYLVIAWALVPVLSLVAAYLVSRVHPDPKEIAAQVQALEPEAAESPGAPTTLPWRTLITAGATLLFAQAAMAATMSVAGAALQHTGHSPDYIVFTLTIHIVAMFAFSPWIGILGDRWGRRPLLYLSAAYLVASTLLIRLVPLGDALLVALIAIGIGWSFAFLGSTAIIVDVARVAHRGRITGVVDLATAVVGAIASLLAGWAVDGGGIPSVGGLALFFALGVLVAAFLAPPRPLPRAVPVSAPLPQDFGK